MKQGSCLEEKQREKKKDFKVTKITKDHPLSEKIKQAYKAIFKTQTGKNILSDVFLCNSKELQFNLGFNIDLSFWHELTKDCEARKDNKYKITNFSKSKKRHYFVVENLDLAVDSWTDMMSNTYIFKPERGDIDFLSVLSHELFIFLDSEFNFANSIIKLGLIDKKVSYPKEPSKIKDLHFSNFLTLDMIENKARIKKEKHFSK